MEREEEGGGEEVKGAAGRGSGDGRGDKEEALEKLEEEK